MRDLVLRHKKAVILGIFGLLVTTVTATCVFFYYRNEDFKTERVSTVSAEEAKEIFGAPPEDLKTLTVLFLGYGGPGHQGGFLTDVIQLGHIDFEKNTIHLISIPRDLWVELPNGKSAKVNQAFTLGQNPEEPVKSGGVVAKEMAEAITGINVDYFVAVDFVGFKRVIGENLRGIEVEITETLDDPWYPITGRELDPCGMSHEEIADLTASYSGFELERQFPCRYEHIHYQPGVVEMHGEDALKFVRSRHGSAGGDFSRSNRQFAVLNGIKNKLFSINGLNNIPNIFEETSRNITTDLNLEVLEYLAPALQNTDSFKTKNIVLSTENVLQSSQHSSGQFILVPKAGANNWVELHNFIQTEFTQPN